MNCSMLCLLCCVAGVVAIVTSNMFFIRKWCLDCIKYGPFWIEHSSLTTMKKIKRFLSAPWRDVMCNVMLGCSLFYFSTALSCVKWFVYQPFCIHLCSTLWLNTYLSVTSVWRVKKRGITQEIKCVHNRSDFIGSS